MVAPRRRRVRPTGRRSAPDSRHAASPAWSRAWRVHFAGCCHPLPGDRIVGIVTTGKGVTIHTSDCHDAGGFAATPERFIDVDWNTMAVPAARTASASHVGRIELIAENDLDALAGLTNAIARQEGAVNNLRIVNRSRDLVRGAGGRGGARHCAPVEVIAAALRAVGVTGGWSGR